MQQRALRVGGREINGQRLKNRTRLDDDRLAEILDVATEVFLAKGFSAASTNEIARQANASKGTFYSRFPNKEALFLAVLERRMQSVFNEVAGSLPAEPPVEGTLRAFSRRFLDIALAADQVALLRVVSMEVQHFPQLGKRFYELGPMKGLEALTAYMRGQIKMERLIQEDPGLMAQHYLSLLSGGAVRWIVLGIDPFLSPKYKQKEHIEAALQAFLRAYGTTPQKKLALKPNLS